MVISSSLHRNRHSTGCCLCWENPSESPLRRCHLNRRTCFRDFNDVRVLCVWRSSLYFFNKLRCRLLHQFVEIISEPVLKRRRYGWRRRSSNSFYNNRSKHMTRRSWLRSFVVFRCKLLILRRPSAHFNAMFEAVRSSIPCGRYPVRDPHAERTYHPNCGFLGTLRSIGDKATRSACTHKMTIAEQVNSWIIRGPTNLDTRSFQSFLIG